MSKLDELLHKRLEKIRDELNRYIDWHLGLSEVKISEPTSKECSEEKHDSVMDKFLHYMKLNDEDEYEYWDSDYQEDECAEIPMQEKQSEKSECSVPSRKPSCNRPSVGGNVSAQRKISDFLKRDRERPELDHILEKKEESFSAMLLRMIDEKGLKDSEVYKQANIDRRLFSKIRGDEDYVPSRKTAISFCMALQLSMDEAKKLLATAGYTLSSSSRFDLIIMYLIENCEYNIHFANIVLDDYGEGSLSR